MRKSTYLSQDVAGIEAFLNDFDQPAPGQYREAAATPSGEFVIVCNMPLPDGFEPDFIDVLLYVPNYPASPPVGLYVLQDNNAETIAQLRSLFNIFQVGYHDAPTFEGYDWICLAYKDNKWSFNLDRVGHGDNLRKFLIRFYNLCQQNG